MRGSRGVGGDPNFPWKIQIYLINIVNLLKIGLRPPMANTIIPHTPLEKFSRTAQALSCF